MLINQSIFMYNALVIIFVFPFISSNKYVPALLWNMDPGDQFMCPALQGLTPEEYAVALHKWNEPRNRLLVVFLENELAQTDFSGKNSKAFSYLSNTSEKVYCPHVQQPMDGIRIHTEDKLLRTSVKNLLTWKDDKIVHDSNAIVVLLDGPVKSETRYEMLKRHDMEIKVAYEYLVNIFPNITPMYTGNRTVEIPDLIRTKRDIVNDSSNGTNSKLFNVTQLLLYLGKSSFYKMKDQILVELNNCSASTIVNGSNLNLTLTGVGHYKIQFQFNNMKNGYWQMGHARIWENATDDKGVHLKPRSSIYAPKRNSFNCLRQVFSGLGGRTLVLNSFQVQPFFGNVSGEPVAVPGHFSDAVDCVGFTSVPILSGLFVSLLFISILTIGLGMMTNIKTMDQFDDAKGKAIITNTFD